MARSSNPFEDEAFSSDNSQTDSQEGSMSGSEDEEGSETGSEDDSRDEMQSTDGESSLVEADPSRSQLAVSDKINYFQQLTKKDPEGANNLFHDESEDSSRFQEGFHDETSIGTSQQDSEGSSEDDDSEDGSDSGSESGSEDESMASEDLSSGSDESYSDEKGSGSGYSDEGDEEGARSSSGMNSRRLLLIGAGICCVILLALVIGIPVGLSNRNKDDDEKETKGNDDAPTLAPGITAVPTTPPPTRPPVRMPVSLPNRPNLREPETIDVEVVIRPSADTTIYREGDNMDNPDMGENPNLYVQGGEPGNPELPSSYALLEFSVDPEIYSYMLPATLNATFCIRREDFDSPNTRVDTTYSACVIGNGVVGGGNVEELTGETATYTMPNDCVFLESMNFVVSSPTVDYCMDLTPWVKPVLNGATQTQRALRGISSSGNQHRSLQDGSENRTVLVMIENMFQSDQPGDTFRSNEYDGNSEEATWPTLTISGKEIVECTTIADVACTDERLSTLCGLIETADLDSFLGDNRQTLTVFAPTNDAIAAAVEKGVVDIEDQEFIFDLILYHAVIYYGIKSKDLNCDYKEKILDLVMANGNSTNIRCKGQDTFVVGKGNTGSNWPKIVDPDIETCNGVVHVIDEMIFPLALSDIIGEDINLDQ